MTKSLRKFMTSDTCIRNGEVVDKADLCAATLD